MNKQNQLLLHVIKTIEYRFIKATAGSKQNFGDFRISDHTRTPNEIINHMSDLVAKTSSLILYGHFNVPDTALLDFEHETKRLLNGLQHLQSVMDTAEIDIEASKKLLQGPILDITTHIGQIAMLNGLHGNKIPKESYYDSNIN